MGCLQRFNDDAWFKGFGIHVFMVLIKSCHCKWLFVVCLCTRLIGSFGKMCKVWRHIMLAVKVSVSHSWNCINNCSGDIGNTAGRFNLTCTCPITCISYNVTVAWKSHHHCTISLVCDQRLLSTDILWWSKTRPESLVDKSINDQVMCDWLNDQFCNTCNYDAKYRIYGEIDTFSSGIHNKLLVSTSHLWQLSIVWAMWTKCYFFLQVYWLNYMIYVIEKWNIVPEWVQVCYYVEYLLQETNESESPAVKCRWKYVDFVVNVHSANVTDAETNFNWHTIHKMSLISPGPQACMGSGKLGLMFGVEASFLWLLLKGRYWTIL